MRRLLIIGCGDVARRALPWLTRHYRVYAVVRRDSTVEGLRRFGVTAIRADLDRPESLKRLAGIGEIVLHCAPPPAHGERDSRTRRLLAALASARILPRRIVYISTSGVYGDCDGDWVDESRPPNPQTARAKRRADAERMLRRFGAKYRVAIVILRAPGIYASDRLPLERIRRRDPVLRAEEDVFTNHIHADDLATIAGRALTRGGAGRAYNACDDAQLRLGDYFDLIADAFELKRPPRVSQDDASTLLSSATLSFMHESRRLVNHRMKRELGVSLRYPTVLSGVTAAREQLCAKIRS